MHEFPTPELVRSLVRHMKLRVQLRRRWALMERAKRDAAERIFYEVELMLLRELDRRRMALH